jgi:hypothetical protein
MVVAGVAGVAGEIMRDLNILSSFVGACLALS